MQELKCEPAEVPRGGPPTDFEGPPVLWPRDDPTKHLHETTENQDQDMRVVWGIADTENLGVTQMGT